MQLDIDIGIALIDTALEKNRDERIFQQWVAQLPVMAITGQVVSFSVYKDRVTGANIDLRSTAEIINEIDEVERELEKGGFV